MRYAAALSFALLACSCTADDSSFHTLAGDNDVLEFTLRADDAVSVGLNHFGLTVRDAHGAEVKDEIVARAHAASNPATNVEVQVQPLGDGKFVLLDVPLSTTGEWVISVSGATRGGSRDSASFDVTVED